MSVLAGRHCNHWMISWRSDLAPNLDLITDYYIAVTSIIDEYYELRAFTHDAWYYVSHQDLNSAIAGTISCLAIGMVRRTVANIFVEFPTEQDTYEAVMQAFTRGGFKAVFGQSMLCPNPDDTGFTIEESLSIYVYRDLYDFIVDYQKNRNGKPTKRMQAHLSDWDPKLDLSKADKNARVAWRRIFTINWLYDLVNVHSYNVLKSPHTKVDGVALEAVPWSFQRTSFAYGQLLGVEEFAGIITTLAMQKPGTDVASRILMWHVFQLQCIVDATTVSRGWSYRMLDQYLKPAPQDYYPRHDIDIFRGETTEVFEGFYWGVRLSLFDLEKDALRFGDPDRYGVTRKGLERIFTHTRTWLGSSTHVLAWSGVPSRFLDHDSNGLWNYSPFLCGTGLMEVLEITYRSTMILWDKICEPLALIHLHNMASQKGYMDDQKTIFNKLTSTFADSFFDQGIIPTKKFDQAWQNRTQNVRTRSLAMQRTEAARSVKHGKDLHTVLVLGHNLYFRRKSNLLLYREAGWNPEHVSEADLEPESVLGHVRISQTRRVMDVETGEMVYEKTELIKRAIAKGATTESLSKFHMISSAAGGTIKESRKTVSSTEPDPRSWSSSTKKFGDTSNHGHAPSGLELLQMMAMDVCQDICGCRPVTGLNYMWITSMMLAVLVEWEKYLERARNPLYIQAFEMPLKRGNEKRGSLVRLVLQERPGFEECLKLLADAIKKMGSNYLEFICWQKASIMQGITCCGNLAEDTSEEATEQTQVGQNEELAQATKKTAEEGNEKSEEKDKQ